MTLHTGRSTVMTLKSLVNSEDSHVSMGPVDLTDLLVFHLAEKEHWRAWKLEFKSAPVYSWATLSMILEPSLLTCMLYG